MTPSTPRRLLFECAWIVGAVMLVLSSIGFVAKTMDGRSDRRAELQQSIRVTREGSVDGVSGEHHASRMASLAGRFSAWEALTQEGAARIEQISSAASRSGVRVTAVQTLADEIFKDAQATVSGHVLTVVGSFAQVGEFLERLQAAKGLVQLDRVRLEPHEAEEGPRVSASLRAVWYALGATAEEGD